MSEYHFGTQIFNSNEDSVLFKSSQSSLSLTDISKISVSTRGQITLENVQATLSYATGNNVAGFINMVYTSSGIYGIDEQVVATFSSAYDTAPMVFLNDMTGEYNNVAFATSSTTGFAVNFTNAIPTTSGIITKRINYLIIDYGT